VRDRVFHYRPRSIRKLDGQQKIISGFIEDHSIAQRLQIGDVVEVLEVVIESR
jgi:hypothetical protein